MSQPRRIVMVTGSYPPDACGVGAYAARLVTELRSQGAEVAVYNKGPWSLRNVSHVANEIRQLKPDVVHIQYPTVGFNRSLGPQALAIMLENVVTTIHEVSQVHLLRRFSLLPFSIGSKAILFTNQFERDYALRFAPWIAKRSHIVPLGGSIPQLTGSIAVRNPLDVVCFGLIRPQKGIEDFIEAAAESKRRKLPFQFTLVGMQDPRFIDYFEDLKRQTHGLPIEWQIGLDDDAVAKRLSKAAFAYLPFPDGATERRTSMIALLAQGIAVLTTASPMTPDIFKSEMQIVANPSTAVDALTQLAADPAALTTQVRRGVQLAHRFDWPPIARRHLEIYESILK